MYLRICTEYGKAIRNFSCVFHIHFLRELFKNRGKFNTSEGNILLENFISSASNFLCTPQLVHVSFFVIFPTQFSEVITQNYFKTIP